MFEMARRREQLQESIQESARASGQSGNRRRVLRDPAGFLSERVKNMTGIENFRNRIGQFFFTAKKNNKFTFGPSFGFLPPQPKWLLR